MSELQRYPDYKDSGVPWLGEIPSHWKAKRIKFVVNNINSKVDAVESDRRYFGLENIESFTGKLKNNIELVSEGIANEFEYGDILFGKLRPYLSKVYMSNLSGLVSTEALVLRPKESITPDFLKYYCLSPDFIDQVNGSTFGSKMPRASWEGISSFKIVYPSIQEQRIIVDFLENELGNIDALISKQQQLLDKLAEQRSAVITHAVTKGLNPNAPMKDSGVEWLGRLPQHWLLTRLKNSISSAQNGVWGNEAEEDDNDLVCIRVADFDRNKLIVKDNNLTIRNISKRDYANRGLKVGDLLLEKSGGGDKQLVGCVVLNTLNDKSVCSNFVAKVSLADGMDPRYWTYHHNALYAAKVNSRSIKQSTGIQNLDSTLYFNELACFPPIEEQRKIAYYLDKETQKVDKMSEAIKNIIVKLQEYRLALITQAVTGKIDVRYISKDLDVEEAG
jgi:type I restriction enzyme S subunit